MENYLLLTNSHFILRMRYAIHIHLEIVQQLSEKDD